MQRVRMDPYLGQYPCLPKMVSFHHLAFAMIGTALALAFDFAAGWTLPGVYCVLCTVYGYGNYMLNPSHNCVFLGNTFVWLDEADE